MNWLTSAGGGSQIQVVGRLLAWRGLRRLGGCLRGLLVNIDIRWRWLRGGVAIVDVGGVWVIPQNRRHRLRGVRAAMTRCQSGGRERLKIEAETRHRGKIWLKWRGDESLGDADAAGTRWSGMSRSTSLSRSRGGEGYHEALRQKVGATRL